MSKKLETLRLAIGKLKSELEVVRDAALPPEETKSSIRSELEFSLSEFQRVQATVAKRIASGAPCTLERLLEKSYKSNEIAVIALGGALTVYGLDRFMNEAEAQAGEPQGLRLTPAQCADKSAAILAELYLLERQEEEEVCLLGVERRPGVNVAAVLGIPLDVARQNGLLGP